MKYVFDSSVLVAALVADHPHHSRAAPWLRKMISDRIEVILSSHSLAEVYAVLTVLPVSPRIAPGLAWRLIRENTPKAKLVHLTVDDYRRTLARMAELALSGGVVYDALIARVAGKVGADGLVTFNAKDFRRVWPEGADRIIAP